MNDMAGSNFVDYVKIFARSGHGGGGSTHFRREKFVAFGGPDGGDGGKGGSIVLQGDKQYWTLIHLKYQRHQFAEDGEHGSGARSSGKDARDIVIPVPLGTVAKRVFENEDGTATTETVGEVTADGERLVLLRGGRGGLGNWHFKSATNQTPRYAQPGGNLDRERLESEILIPISRNKAAVYRPFNCRTLSLREPVTVLPGRLNIVEGSYSFHPELARYYDLSVFLDISPETQRSRILKRNGPEWGQQFFDRWVPLEQTYFHETDTQGRCTLALKEEIR